MPGPGNLRFRSRFRLRRHGEFQHLMKQGKRAGDHRLQIWALPNNLEYSRFGLIVGRRHGNAVRRNRLKRVLREAFRLSRAKLPSGLDIACAPRAGVKIELQETIESLLCITKRLSNGFESD